MTKKVYFASDFHLGADVPHEDSYTREKKIIRWLDQIFPDTKELFLVGDLFDYWFEYNKVIPKGYTRFLAKLCQFTDSGIPVHVFSGNHDMWMFDYLEKEIGVIVHHKPIGISLGTKKFYIGHGDGLGPGDLGYKMIKRIFRNPINQWLFARLHPNLGIKIMRSASSMSRAQDGDYKNFLGPKKEWLILYCESILKNKTIDYFIFGHRHLPIYFNLSNKQSVYVNLGDMITHNTFASFDGGLLKLQSFEKTDSVIFGN